MSSLLKKIKTAPDAPGVYFFLGRNKKILYIGKATSIRDRMRSYFNTHISESRGPLIQQMLSRAISVNYVRTDSVLEALILEARLIKKHQPPFNTKEKSDKSFNYVVITNEDFPRIIIVRGRNLKANEAKKLQAQYGPFPHGSVLTDALKIIRKIFPFRDSCIPFTRNTCAEELQNIRRTSQNLKISIPRKSAWSPRLSVPKPCFGRQIGLCPGVCTGEITQTEYKKTIRNIRLLFEGKKKILMRTLTAEMNAAARKKEFEKAGEIKKTLRALKHIQDISLIKQEGFPRNSALGVRTSAPRVRVEAYDVAHLSGTNSVGVMTVVEDGEAQKKEYRKFIIRNEKKGSDTDALAEIIERRLAHTDWQLPRLIVVDGGKAQMNVVRTIFKKYEIQIPIVGVVKNEHHRPKRILGDRNLIYAYEKEILLANSEAHRFALSFHRKKRMLHGGA